MSDGHLHSKRAGDGGLSTSSIVIIVVVSVSVLILALILFLWRVIYRTFSRNQPAPLPPVQPLARQREQHLAAFSDKYASRPSTFFEYEGSQAGHSTTRLLSGGASASSLLRDSYAVSSKASLNGEGSYGSRGPTPLSADDDVAAPDGTGDLEAQNGVVPPSPSIPFSDAMSAESHTTSESTRPLAGASEDIYAAHRRVPRARSGVRPSISRPASVASSVRTDHTSRSKSSTIRGAPHSIHSNVQIVLPAPLAPEVYPYGDPSSNFHHSRSSSAYSMRGDQDWRRSNVDQWVVVGRPASSVGNLPQRPVAEPRVPSKLSQSFSPHNSARRRSQSQPHIDVQAAMRSSQPAPPVPSRASQRRAPSVPRLPSAYSEHSPPYMPAVKEWVAAPPTVHGRRHSPGPVNHYADEQRGRSYQRRSTVSDNSSANLADLADKALPPQPATSRR